MTDFQFWILIIAALALWPLILTGIIAFCTALFVIGVGIWTGGLILYDEIREYFRKTK